MYITNLKIHRFKSHVNSNLNFKNVTLLTGLNGSGKSSIFQSVRMLWELLKTEDPTINEYGELDTLINRNSKDKSFLFEIELEDKSFINLTYSNNEGIKYIKKEDIINDYNLAYISASRLGPTVYQNIRNKVHHEMNVGSSGEFTLDILLKNAIESLPEEFRDTHDKQNTLEFHVEKWLKEVSPNIELKTELNKRQNIASFSINGFTPFNVGFGVSYTLSIIVQLLYAVILYKNKNIKSIILIENPEAHLHPRGQTKMAELISIISNYGVQVIVETHSDYILDGLRLSVKDNIIEHKKTRIYYFELFKDEINFDWNNTAVIMPEINEQGLLNQWPTNFFDTSKKNKKRFLK